MLVIDAANVVGSRPDGWWRDRVGAASRLIGQVLDAVRVGAVEAPVTVVLEGSARPARARYDGKADLDGVAVVEAAASGDDTIVDITAREVGRGSPVVVVTADRELRRRVGALGASVVSTGWLLDRLEPRR